MSDLKGLILAKTLSPSDNRSVFTISFNRAYTNLNCGKHVYVYPCENENLKKSFNIPDSIQFDEELQAIKIIDDLLKEVDHNTQNRILDYFKSKYNMSKPIITKIP